jgi:hypothetical protein
MPITIDGTSGITFPNNTLQASAGQVLQVVNANHSTSVSNSTSTYADTGLTASITPKFATSKILVLINQNGLRKSAGNVNNSINLQLVRNSTVVSQISTFTGYTNTLLDLIIGSASTSYLDSPATISSTTYKTQFSSGFNTASVSVQDNNAQSTITLMEIAA